MKTVCIVDDKGFFVGLDRAFDSPREPGVYLIPAGCVDVEPPKRVEGYRARLAEGGKTWVQVEAAYAEAVADAAGPELVGKDAIEYLMDKAAQQHGYKNMDRAVTFAEEPEVPAYQEECRRLRAWRSRVWAWFYEDPARAAMAMVDLAQAMPVVPAAEA